jgi:hypothetical protein
VAVPVDFRNVVLAVYRFIKRMNQSRPDASWKADGVCGFILDSSLKRLTSGIVPSVTKFFLLNDYIQQTFLLQLEE